MDESSNGRIDEWTNRWMDESMNRRIDELTNRYKWMNWPIDELMKWQIHLMIVFLFKRLQLLVSMEPDHSYWNMNHKILVYCCWSVMYEMKCVRNSTTSRGYLLRFLTSLYYAVWYSKVLVAIVARTTIRGHKSSHSIII